MLMRNISCFCINKCRSMSLLVGCVVKRDENHGLTIQQPLIEDGVSSVEEEGWGQQSLLVAKSGGGCLFGGRMSSSRLSGEGR